MRWIGSGLHSNVYQISDGLVLKKYKKRKQYNITKNIIQELLKTLNNKEHILLKNISFNDEDREVYMKLCDGYKNCYDIESFIEESYFFSIKDRINILSQIVDGMIELSGKGYIHGDLKLKNIFIQDYENSNFQIVIGDFDYVRKSNSLEDVYKFRHLIRQLFVDNGDDSHWLYSDIINKNVSDDVFNIENKEIQNKIKLLLTKNSWLYIKEVLDHIGNIL